MPAQQMDNNVLSDPLVPPDRVASIHFAVTAAFRDDGNEVRTDPSTLATGRGFSGIRSGERRRGFTLVELLVVIGIIALLISILLPALNKARRSSQEVTCKPNLRQVMMALLLFANEHKQHLPGGHYDRGNSDIEKRDWLFGNQPYTAFPDPAFVPSEGTIFRYINRDGRVLRCPSLDPDPQGYHGSNGMFD